MCEDEAPTRAEAERDAAFECSDCSGLFRTEDDFEDHECPAWVA